MTLAAQRGLEGQQELVAQGTGQPTGLSPSLTGVAMLPAPPRLPGPLCRALGVRGRPPLLPAGARCLRDPRCGQPCL